MITSRKLRYLILIAFFITMPIHPKSFSGYCSDTFTMTKRVMGNVIHGRISTNVKIGLGAVSVALASFLTYVLIKKAIQAHKYAQDKAFFEEKGLNIKYLDGDDLVKAVKEHDEQLILMLIKYKISINRSRWLSDVNSSPLGVAIMKNASLVDLLLKNTPNDQEKLNLALSFAIEKGKLHDNCNKSLSALLKYKKNISPFLAEATLHNPVALEILIKHGKSNGTLSEKDLSLALIHVSKESLNKERRKGIRTLLKHGANINEKELVKVDNPDSTPLYKQVKTPLSEAITHGNPDMVRFLLKQGAELVRPDNEVNAYDYIKDIKEDFEKTRTQKVKIFSLLENHRLKLAKDYNKEIEKEAGNYLSKNIVDTVCAYVEPVYPLMKKRPLSITGHCDDGCGSDSDID